MHSNFLMVNFASVLMAFLSAHPLSISIQSEEVKTFSRAFRYFVRLELHTSICFILLFQTVFKIRSGHRANIFSAKFLPNSQDAQVRLNEPQHDKTNKMTFAPSKDPNAQSDQSLRCSHEGILGPTEWTVKTLIRLGKCIIHKS